MAVSAAEYYEVRWRPKDSEQSWSAPQRIAPNDEIVVKGLDRTREYEFEVRAVSNCGAKSVWVSSDYTVPAPPPLPAVNIPTGSGMPDGIQLNWGDGAAPRGDIQYEISRAPATGSYTVTPPPAGDASWARVAIVSGTTWVDAVTDTANYWYRLRTVDFNGNTGSWAVIAGPAAASISTPELSASVQTSFADAQSAIDDLTTQADQLRTDVDAASDAVTQEVTDRTSAISNEANARATAILNEQNARIAAISTEQAVRQSADDSLATIISQVSAGTGEQFDPAKIWYFDTTVEGWTGNGTPTITDGWLRAANHATDPYVASPTGLAVAGQSYRFAKLRIKKVGTPAWAGELRWRLTGDAAGSWRGPVSIDEPDYDVNGVTTISWQDIAWWPGTIDQVRVDLTGAQTASNYYLIDWVAVGRPTPGAGVAALQDETAARVTADSAEATQRTTLATQMRGSYTGTDVAGITTGLLYSEIQARSTADGAMATDISSLQARMPAGTGKVATEASVTDEASARVTADGALSTRTGAMEARMPSGTGALATSADVTTEQTARATADTAMAADISLLGAHNAGKTAFILDQTKVQITPGTTFAQMLTGLQASDTALNARVDSEQTARVAGDNANAASITSITARVGATEKPSPNLLPNPTGAIGAAGWTAGATSGTAPALNVSISDARGPHFSIGGYTGSGTVFGQTNIIKLPNIANANLVVSGEVYSDGGTPPVVGLQMFYYDSANSLISNTGLLAYSAGSAFVRISAPVTTPSNCAGVVIRILAQGPFTGNIAWQRMKLEFGTVATPYSEEKTNANSATVTQALTANVGPSGAYAQATTMLDVNGHITGVSQTNNGTTGDFIIVADKFGIVSPAGGARTEYSNGNWRVYDSAGTLRVALGVNI